MRQSCRQLLLLSALLTINAAHLGAQTPTQIDPARVLVIYNQNFPDQNGNGLGDSEEIALAYQVKRNIPTGNLFAVSCSTNNTYYSQLSGWTAFYNEVRTPIVDFLNLVGPTSIDTFLFCYGVPYQLSLAAADGGVRSLDQSMTTPHSIGTASLPLYGALWATSSYKDQAPTVGADKRHFDHGFVHDGNDMYLTARLDGPDLDSVLDLIEGARYADLYLWNAPGYYQGNFYVDTRFSNYPNPGSLPYPNHHGTYAGADQDLAWCTTLFDNFGFPFLWENTSNDLEIGDPGATFQTGATAELAPDAMFYYGWYNYNKYNDVWSFLPGSAACDLNSNSAASIRNPTAGNFLPGAFRNGLTCGAGSIAEPYLNGHPFPEVFVYYLLNGFSFAEAAAVSDSTAKWRSLYVGDPLYCPMLQGKLPALDTTPPPAPALVALGGSSTEQDYSLSIDTTGRDPDLVRVVGLYGRAPLLDQPIAASELFSLTQSVRLDGLSGSAFYRAALELVDPSGNLTPAPDEALFFNDGASDLRAAVQSDVSAQTAFTPFTLEFGARFPGGAAAATGFSMTLDAPHRGLLGFNLMPLLFLFPITLHGNLATGETFSLELEFPNGLPPGTYTFHLDTSTSSATAHDLLTIVIS